MGFLEVNQAFLWPNSSIGQRSVFSHLMNREGLSVFKTAKFDRKVSRQNRLIRRKAVLI